VLFDGHNEGASLVRLLAEPARPGSAEIAAATGPLSNGLVSTAPSAAAPAAKAGPSLMTSTRASKSFARTLAHAAEPEGGLRRLAARVFHEAGCPVPDADLKPRKRRTCD